MIPSILQICWITRSAKMRLEHVNLLFSHMIHAGILFSSPFVRGSRWGPSWWRSSSPWPGHGPLPRWPPPLLWSSTVRIPSGVLSCAAPVVFHHPDTGEAEPHVGLDGLLLLINGEMDVIESQPPHVEYAVWGFSPRRSSESRSLLAHILIPFGKMVLSSITVNKA